MSPRKNPSQPVTVALLRGINVGGKHSLPMKNSWRSSGRAKCDDVRTYIQSGNVIFSASAAVIEGISECIAKKIESALWIRLLR